MYKKIHFSWRYIVVEVKPRAVILKVSLILTKLVFLSGIGFIFISKSWTRGHIYGSDVPLTILEKPLKLAPVKHCKNCQLLFCHSSMFYQLRQELFALDCAIKDPQWVTLSIFTLPNPTQHHSVTPTALNRYNIINATQIFTQQTKRRNSWERTNSVIAMGC